MTSKYNTFQELFLAAIDRYSGHALFRHVDSPEVWSYGEFGAAVMSAAARLRSEGLARHERVIVLLPNSIEFFSAFSAIILAGGSPVLGNPGYSIPELMEILRQTDARIIVAADEALHRFKGEDESLQLVPSSRFSLPSPDRPCSQNISSFPDSTPDDEAYVMYTSGSSGKPKGIRTTHENLLQAVSSIGRAHNLPDDCVHLCLLPMFHASALIRSLLIPFSQGSEIVIAPDFQVSRFWQWIANYGIGFVQVVPTILITLLNHPKDPPKEILSLLHYIGSASAPLSATTSDRFEKRFGVPIAQGFGMTETCSGVCFNDPRKKQKKPGSVGQPIDVMTVTIQGEDGRPLPQGELGAILISGPTTMKGLVGDTEKLLHFIPGKQISSGDLGYLDEDGYLFIEGRLTDVIDRGAFKVSPKEVEEALLAIPGIMHAVAFGIPHETQGQDIISYAWWEETENLSEPKIRSALRSRLAPYKIPSRVLRLTDGYSQQDFKISRKAYRERYFAEHIGQAAKERPGEPKSGQDPKGPSREDILKSVINVIGEAFAVDPIGIRPEMSSEDIEGWDSFGKITLWTLTEERFGINISAEEMIPVESVGDLANLVEKKMHPIETTLSGDDFDSA